MVKQSLTTRLAQERLEAIKKFIPVRDRVRQQLQQRQIAKSDYSSDISQLFSPVTSTTAGVTSAIQAQPNIVPMLEQIATETGATTQQIANLSEQLQLQQQQMQRLPGIEYSDPSAIKPKYEDALSSIEFDSSSPVVEEPEEKESAVEKIFFPHALKKIRSISDEKELVKFAANNFPASIRRNLTSVTHDKYVSNMKDWAKKVYLVNKGKRNKSEVDAFVADVKNYRSITGKGIGKNTNMRTANSGIVNNGNTSMRNKSISDHITCPGNILGDVSRLQVLIGGARAGNNSHEIINEAADICRRLFQGGIMNIHDYRDLISELADDKYYSD